MKKALTIGLATALAVLPAGGPAVAGETPGHGGHHWAAPGCRKIIGDGSVTFTWDEGRTIAPTSEVLHPVVYTTGLVTLDRPGALLALANNTLLSSADAGCTWTKAGTVNGSNLGLVAAPGGRAYAWDRSAHLTLTTPAGATPLTAPATRLAGLGTDPHDGGKVRVSDGHGQLYDSRDGGQRWRPAGTSAGLDFLYTAAFDPARPDHVVLGGEETGARVTFDGGRRWIASTGLGDRVNVFTVSISPAAPNVVYAMGLNLDELKAGDPSGGRHIYRSADGGRHFTPVVDQGGGVTLINGPEMAAHPTDPDVVYFVFGTSFNGYGTDLYRYDARRRQVTATHNSYDKISSIAFNPATPRVMYLGVAEER